MTPRTANRLPQHSKAAAEAKAKPRAPMIRVVTRRCNAFALFCAKYAREKYDHATCGAEFMKHGLAMLTGLPLAVASAQVQQMLADHDRKIASALLQHADTSKRN